MIKSIYRNKGIALPIVVILILIISILIFTAAFIVQSQLTTGSRYGNREKSLSYAEAGINRYLWHLNKDSKYYEKTTFLTGEVQPLVKTSYQNGYFYIGIVLPTTAKPVVTIRSTGWSMDDPNNKITVEVQVHKKSFTQSVYLSGAEQTPDNGSAVWWITGDDMFGPIHSNGSINIDGDPEFHDKVTYSGTAPNIQSGSHPIFAITGDPEKVPQLAFPASNSQLKTLAQLGGYYYNGRTCIYMHGSSIDVRRYDITTRAWIYQTNVSLPSNGVIFVDGSANNQWDVNTGNAFISGKLDGRLTVAAANNIYITGKDPTNTSYTNATTTNGVTYQIPVFTGSWVLSSPISDDMLGLVANGYVRILHSNWPTTSSPYYTSNNASDVAPTNITIEAAIFALNWAFEYENYNQGNLKGNITFSGSITQKYRGAVGTFNSGSNTRVTGYNKQYYHDPRMAYDSPPHFLEPTNAGWEMMDWVQVANPVIP